MIVALDHIQIAAHDVAAAARAYQIALGVAQREQPGSVTFEMENTRLRIIAADEHEDQGLSSLVFAVDDLTRARHQLERRGAPTTMVEGGDEPAALIAPDASHGVRILLTEARARGPTTASARGDALHALDHVVIRTSNADRAVAFYGARLGLDLRLDRTNPAWNARLLFFRCGDMVVEISAEPQASASSAPDRLDGLAWRTRDPDGARARMAAAGLDASEVRPGRKPGTRVFTLRSGLVGAPSLIISAPTADLA